MSKRYPVTLTEDERAALGQRVAMGRGSAGELTHARILLKADRGPHGPAWTDKQVATAPDASLSTVSRVRLRFVEQGLDPAIRRQRPRRGYRRGRDGEQESHLVALACSSPPLGRRRWTLRLLADKLVELGYIDGVSHETVRQARRKDALKPWLTKRWCIPPKSQRRVGVADGGHPQLYTRPYDPPRPLVCPDEASKQLIAETELSTIAGQCLG